MINNPFWNTILMTVLGAVSFVGAKITANWIAEHTWRAERSQPGIVQMVQPNYQRDFRRVTVPKHFRQSYRRHSRSRPYRRYRMRH